LIALLTGVIAHKSPDFIILDVNGVGYRVHIPFSTYYDLPDEGGKSTLHIHTNVKEDAIHLYGFRTPAEKTFFQLLIGISGVGPKLANGILSNIPVDDLRRALMSGDLVRLAAVPGIGKKTAERLVLELRDKVLKLDPGVPPMGPEEASTLPAPGITDDVASALINLGYKELVVKKALAEVHATPDDTVETLLKQVLKLLMK
jgi:Holliday junction DNA helicase RuvA